MSIINNLLPEFIRQIKNQIKIGGDLDKILNNFEVWYEEQKTNDLVHLANLICKKVYGQKVYLRGLIEFSNICNCDCLYCGIRKSNEQVNRYLLSNETIFNIIKNGYAKGFKTFVLQSGENQNNIPDKISSLLYRIRKELSKDIAITLSCGTYPLEVLKQWKKDGANRYLIRFETSDETLYSKLCPGKRLQDRIDTIINLRSLGYEVGSGFMIGLPDEDVRTRLKNILLSYTLELDMVGIGPFIPHSQTPLADTKSLSIEETIRMTALLRIFLPYSNIPATTAAGTLDIYGREKMLESGANVLMPNITPLENKKDYLLYPGKICLDEDGYKCLSCLDLKTSKIGKKISLERGDSLYKRKKLKKFKNQNLVLNLLKNGDKHVLSRSDN